jgi:hypothetical protein
MMHFRVLVHLLAYTYLVTAASAFPEPSKVHNANHVFNAVHSSMRQWGSSLNHNGMSFFMATVPAGTQLYHGTPYLDTVQGLEWLAFEPEHALIFARPNFQSTDGGRNLPRGLELSENQRLVAVQDREDKHSLSAATTLRQPQAGTNGQVQAHTKDGVSDRTDHKQQQPLVPTNPQPLDKVGYLHTYAPKHDLHLLYIDGLSAGKTPNGTLDTQDMLILNISTGPGGPMGGEWKRARGMCELASTLWENKVDGIVRMEAGFEIILCDFEKHLIRTDVIGIEPRQSRHQPGSFGGWPYIQAITSRYHGIGGGRGALDYEHFVSVFAYPDIEGLFDNDVQSDLIMPRLQNVKVSDRMRVRNDVNDMILNKDWETGLPVQNWQGVADMVVARYSKPVHYLHTDKQIRLDTREWEEYLLDLLKPFIFLRDRNTTQEVARCTAQYVPVQRSTSLSYDAIYTVTEQICFTLITAIPATPQALERVDRLYEYLQWTTWKECGTCPDEQVCYIPIWPFGNPEDHAKPRCRNEESAANRWYYWGDPFARRPRLEELRE